MLGRPPFTSRSYIAENFASSPLSASLNHARIGRNGWSAGTNASSLIVLNNAGISDLAGNAGSGITNSANYAVQTEVPTATIVVADNSLTIGETSLVTIAFSEAASISMVLSDWK